ncbi:protein NUCLEAR FUSION DEFECTIVE 6, mitochondrial-like isoform X1 [Rutidosis leptorrhynchoides]|uniref:protein NUCLEAR FUSION DEFECTIVE 6, mitochondrial-like isoform X1 n=1 Tax=Rutidosis leptorrhynchoides TaxID=125765 RepID=UPI003A996868
MAGAAAARSFFRSTSVRNATARVTCESKCKTGTSPSPSSFRFSTIKPNSNRIIFRCPVEMSACLETMQPFHTVNASALMTSLLTLSRSSYAWLPQGVDDTS